MNSTGNLRGEKTNPNLSSSNNNNTNNTNPISIANKYGLKDKKNLSNLERGNLININVKNSALTGNLAHNSTMLKYNFLMGSPKRNLDSSSGGLDETETADRGIVKSPYANKHKKSKHIVINEKTHPDENEAKKDNLLNSHFNSKENLVFNSIKSAKNYFCLPDNLPPASLLGDINKKFPHSGLANDIPGNSKKMNNFTKNTPHVISTLDEPGPAPQITRNSRLNLAEKFLDN